MTDEFNRYYIKIRVILGINPKTIFEELTEALEPDAPSYSMVKSWAKRFREGREDVSDDPRSGRPISVLTVENIECVRQIIEDDPHSTYEDIIVKTDLSRGTIERIINCIVNLGHSLLPFIINIISALAIMITVARNRFTCISKKQQTFLQHFNDQFHQHKHLFISPIILIILVIPRLVISFISGCMKSARNPWIYLLSYFISLMPPLMTFFVFVLPSETNKNEFIKSTIMIRTFFKKFVVERDQSSYLRNED